MIELKDSEYWTKRITDSEEHLSKRINAIIETDENVRIAFQNYLEHMQAIYPSLNFQDTINMMSENIIRKSIFTGVFEKSAMLKESPTYILEQNVMMSLAPYSLETETSYLNEFYNLIETIMTEAKTLNEKKQIALELEEDFFKIAFPNRVKRHNKIFMV
jgi:predicted helicase